MSVRSRVLGFEFLFVIIVLNITSANNNLQKSARYTYGEMNEVQVEDEQQTIKCQTGNGCEAFCFEQNKATAVEGGALNDSRCVSSGYHLNFVFSNMTTLRPGWFVNNAIIKTISIRGCTIVEIEPGAFDDCIFRSVYSLEIRATGITSIKKGALAGLYNLKTLSLYANNEMRGIEENALESLYQLEEFVMEDQKQFLDLGNVTEKSEWKYLRTLSLSKNSFGSTIKKPTFRGCKRVQKLNLSNSEIEAIGPHSFELMIETIEVLDLRNNRLKNLPTDMLQNLIRTTVQLYLSNNLWDCSCTSLELQKFESNHSSLINDSPLTCETPEAMNGHCMRDVVIECYSTTPATTTTYQTGSVTYQPNVDHLSCYDEADAYPSVVAVETEYQ